MKLGFIGMGNMATALLRGFLSSGQLDAADVAAEACEKIGFAILRGDGAGECLRF